MSRLNQWIETHAPWWPHWRARIGWALILVTVLVGGLRGESWGRVARETADDAKAIVEQLERDRIDAQMGACIQANVTTEKIRASLVAGLRSLAPDPTDLTDREQTILDHYAAAVETALPYRDCTPEGIARYFENPPTDPAIKTNA